MQQDKPEINTQIRHISHEIRNNLSICDVYSEIIKKHLIKSGIQNESIENAINCIQNSLKLIGNSLIDLKSFDNIHPQVLESDKLILEAVELSKIYAKDKDIVFDIKLEKNAKILIDESKLKGCIINLIKNGIEAIDKPANISVKSYIDNDKLIISVSNTGDPIPENIQPRLFDDGFTTKNSGSGIGLYLCKKNLEAQGGSTYLKQSDDKITEFIISVKLFSI